MADGSVIVEFMERLQVADTQEEMVTTSCMYGWMDKRKLPNALPRTAAAAQRALVLKRAEE